MKVVLTGASKGHPGCTGVHQEKGSPLWKTPSTFDWIGKTGAEMAGKPAKTKQPSLQVCKAHWDQRGSDVGSGLCVLTSPRFYWHPARQASD